MKPYRVLQLGDKFLMQKVPEIYILQINKEDLKPIVERMIETCLQFNGKGLSANQVGENLRLFVMKPTGHAHFKTYINPRIVASGGRARGKEGCLSFAEPKVYYNVRRKFWVELEYETLDKDTVKERYEDFDARCVQHEIDHLDGILMNMKGQKA